MSITDTGDITVSNLDDKYDEAYRIVNALRSHLDSLDDEWSKTEARLHRAEKEFKELEQLKQDQDDRDERNLP